jgi:endonuclease-3
MPRESKAAKKQRAAAIVQALKDLYPSAECALQYEGEPWRLLVMGRLSAQCTDARVNIVCRDLFARFSTPKAMAEAPLEEIEAIVRPCGLFHTKAANIKDACARLVNDYGGILPDDMD